MSEVTARHGTMIAQPHDPGPEVLAPVLAAFIAG